MSASAMSEAAEALRQAAWEKSRDDDGRRAAFKDFERELDNALLRYRRRVGR